MRCGNRSLSEWTQQLVKLSGGYPSIFAYSILSVPSSVWIAVFKLMSTDKPN
jgi:hypothetical protein